MGDSGLVYHYTGIDGLLGILGKEELWLSNFLYSNDKEELQFGLKLYKKIIASQSSDLVTTFADIVEMLYATFQYYICSFSPHGSQLSQWRGYTSPEGAFSIGVDISDLRSLKNGTDSGIYIEIKDCIYGESAVTNELEEAIKKIQDTLIGRFPDNLAKPSRVKSITETIFNEIVPIIAVAKHSIFYQEEEIRYMMFPQKSTEMSFRRNNNLILPYITTPFPRSIIRKINIGPQVKQEQNYEAIKLMLHSYGMEKNCELEIVDSPYCGW